MTIYASVLYTQALRRKYFGLFGPKRNVVEMIGVCLLPDKRAFGEFIYLCDLSYKSRRDERQNYSNIFSLLPPMSSGFWESRSDLLLSVREFLEKHIIDNGTLTIVTPADPIAIGVLGSLFNEASIPVHLNCRFKTVEQRIEDSIAWLPDSAYGVESDFSTYFPVSDSNPYETWQKRQMFMSHDLMTNLEYKDTDSLYDRCTKMNKNYTAVDKVMQYEMRRLTLQEPDAIAEQIINTDQQF